MVCVINLYPSVEDYAPCLIHGVIYRFPLELLLTHDQKLSWYLYLLVWWLLCETIPGMCCEVCKGLILAPICFLLSLPNIHKHTHKHAHIWAWQPRIQLLYHTEQVALKVCVIPVIIPVCSTVQIKSVTAMWPTSPTAHWVHTNVISWNSLTFM